MINQLEASCFACLYILTRLFKSSGSCDVFLPYMNTEIKKPKIAYVHDTLRSMYKFYSSLSLMSPSGIEVSAVAMAEKADKVNDRRKFVS